MTTVALRIATLEGVLLDHAVGLAQAKQTDKPYVHMPDTLPVPYSTSWLVGGDLITCERMSVMYNGYLRAWKAAYENGTTAWGTTPLEAAARCYAWKIHGPVVDMPAELVPTPAPEAA